jgi:hypothetical protein
VAQGTPGGTDSTATVDKAREALDRTIAALGGAAFLNVREIQRRGRLYSFDRGELAGPGEHHFVDYVKLPDKERSEFGKKGNIVYVNNGEEGWELDRQGVREQTPEAIRDFHEGNRHDLDYLLRYRLTESGMQAYYLGSEFSDNRRAYVIELVDERSESVKLLVDVQTYLPMQLRYRTRDALSGEWVDVTDTFGNYISVQGVQTAKIFSRERAGKRTLEVFWSEVHYNSGLSDELFSRGSLEARWQKAKKK